MKSHKNPKITIEKYTEFKFAHRQNAINVAMVLGSAGYFIKIKEDSAYYLVEIYTYEKKGL